MLANSTSYGIFAEMNRKETGLKNRTRITVHGLDDVPFSARVSGPEEPGDFCFPPLAAFVAGAARLMLAMLERCVTDLGGTYDFCDTDSMAIVATDKGELVPCREGPHRKGRRDAVQALSQDKVERIVARFAALNPCDREAILGSVLEVEDENFARCGTAGHKSDCVCTKERHNLHCLAISAKRYALFNVDEKGHPDLRKWSEYGLGHLLNPTDPDSEDRDWMRQVWEGIVREELGFQHTWPDWLDRPALSRLTISSPELLRPFQQFNADKDYVDQIKRGNFLLAAHIKPFGHPDRVDPEHFQLFAPFESNPSTWERLPWVDRYSGKAYRITNTGSTGGPGSARVQTYRDGLEAFRHHPEAKSADAHGQPSGRQMRGLLQRRRVSTRPELLTHVGKESNKLEEVEAGLEHELDEVYTEYTDPHRNPWSALFLPVLREIPVSRVAAAVGISERSVRKICSGQTRPRPQHLLVLKHITAAFAQARLRERGVRPPSDPILACSQYHATTIQRS